MLSLSTQRKQIYFQLCITQGLTTFHAVQAKERTYHNRRLTDQFLPLAIEVFDFVHKYVNVFLHNCANAI
jgi:hypothetical protein